MPDQTAAPPQQTEASNGFRPFAGYSPHEHRPLKPYGLMSSTFIAAFVGSLVVADRSGRELPSRVGARDIALIGIATHKLSRLISKDKVTSFLRAPFVRYEEPSGQGEVSEEARGEGLQKAVGELLNCPYCLGQWVAGAFTVGLVAAPRPTRLIASMYVAETIADFLQLAYVAAEERA